MWLAARTGLGACWRRCGANGTRDAAGEAEAAEADASSDASDAQAETADARRIGFPVKISRQ